MAEAANVSTIGDELRDDVDPEAEAEAQNRRRRVPRDVEVYDINGPFFFGAAEKFRDALRQVHWRPRAIVFDMEHVPVIDSTGLRALTEVVRQTRQSGCEVYLTDLGPEPRRVIAESSIAEMLGPGRLELSFDDALELLGPTAQFPRPDHAPGG
ncbi:MAG: sodium-independent anion transporter [Gemmatimonadales bacterium]